MRVFPASDPMISPVYALNLFNVSNRDGCTVLILVERKTRAPMSGTCSTS